MYAAVAVFALETSSECEPLTAFDKDMLVYMSPIKRERENTGRCALRAGQAYVIVASPEQAGTTAAFHLSLYLNAALRDVEVKRVFHPLDLNEAKEKRLPELIPEEAEKLVSLPPPWKIRLVKDSQAYMMSQEDRAFQRPADW